MNRPIAKEENSVIYSAFKFLSDAMNESDEPEKVLLRFIRGIEMSHPFMGPYALGHGTMCAIKDERTCRVCGCTETTACATEEGPCAWVQADLCSACVRIVLEEAKLTFGRARIVISPEDDKLFYRDSY